MAWVEASLRGKKVFARARDDGALVVEGGRVEVRYKTNDGRAYRAAVANIERIAGAKVFVDGHCSDVTESPPKTGARSSGKRAVASPFNGDPKPGATAQVASATDWIAYTDGACSGNPGPAGAGFVIIAPGKSPLEGYESLGTGTNNVAEITAILRAIEAIPRNASVVVHTDSKYAIGVLSMGWKAKANQELVAKTRRALEGRKVRFVYVPGHSGIPLNERADELAREAIRTEKTRLIMLP